LSRIIKLPASEEIIEAFLLMQQSGLNTRRPYDSEYEEWIQVFSKLLGTSAASVSLHEEEVANRKRGIAQAARDRAALNDELTASEFRLETLHDVAEKVGLGYFEYELDGNLKHANVRLTLSSSWIDTNA
jgi:hypothetical protein